MLGQDDIEDIAWIFDFDDEFEDKYYTLGIAKRAFELYRSRFNFFTPYNDRRDFFYDVISLVRNPLLFTMGAVVMAFNTLVAACYCVGNLLLILGATIFMSPKYYNSGLEGVADALVHVGRALLGTATAVLLAVLSIPHALASLISRTFKTISSGAIIDCCSDDEEVVLSPYLTPE